MTAMTKAIDATMLLQRSLGDWNRRVRTRRELGRMSARLLVDVGLSPEAVAQECRQPFWRELACELGAEAASSGARQTRGTPGPALPPEVRSVARLPAAVFPCRA